MGRHKGALQLVAGESGLFRHHAERLGDVRSGFARLDEVAFGAPEARQRLAGCGVLRPSPVGNDQEQQAGEAGRGGEAALAVRRPPDDVLSDIMLFDNASSPF